MSITKMLRLEDVAVRTDADIRPAAEALRDIALDLVGLHVAASANISSRRPMVDKDGNILAYSVFRYLAKYDRWWETPNRVLASPVMTACRYESEPFWCSRDGFHTRHQLTYLDSIDLSSYDEQVIAPGVAIVVPVHLPFGQVGAVGFRSPDPERSDLSVEYAQYADELALYARRFISDYVRVSGQRWQVPPNCRLVGREIECLYWVASGKTDSEIAVILHRSSAAVRFHLQNLGHKLGTHNRSQAVFKATQLGYITLE